MDIQCYLSKEHLKTSQLVDYMVLEWHEVLAEDVQIQDS